ncbi:hypothetical protein DFH09DRAFT_1326130 [Mycena vulgaris]|nr:hypothetical protein DFH09DRAFT_1326130 [Mycena vulgaris]
MPSETQPSLAIRPMPRMKPAQGVFTPGSAIGCLAWIPTTVVIPIAVEDIPAAPPPPSARPPDTGSHAQHIDGFGGAPQPVQGNVATRRSASSSRSLPPRNPFVAAFVNHHGPQTPFPASNTAPAVAESKVIVVCWPLMPSGSFFEPTGYPAPKISVHNDHDKRYAERFKQFHLVFTIKVPTQGLEANLGPHHISLPPCPANVDPGSPDDLHSHPFVILKASVKNSVYTLQPHGEIYDNKFTYQELAKLHKKLSNPLTGEYEREHIWFWIGERASSQATQTEALHHSSSQMGPVLRFRSNRPGNVQKLASGIRRIITAEACIRSL